MEKIVRVFDMPRYSCEATYRKPEGFEEGDLTTLREYATDILETLGVNLGVVFMTEVEEETTPYGKIKFAFNSAKALDKAKFTEELDDEKIIVKIRKLAR